jgi:hypothetical protein
VNEFALTTPWDITTATNVAGSGTSILAQDTSSRAIFFKPDGTKMYMHGSTQRVYEYTLGTAWWSNTASNVGAFVGSTWYGITPTGLQFNSTGSQMYVANSTGNIQVFLLSTPWSVNSASYNSYFYANNSVEGAYQGFSFNSSGNSLVLTGSGTGKSLVQFNLATPYDLTTAVYVGRQYYHDPIGGDNAASGMYGVYYADSVNSVFVQDQASDTVSQWSTNTSGVIVTSTGTTLFDGNVVNLANVLVAVPGTLAGTPGYVNIFGNIITSGVTQSHYIGGTINYSALSGTTLTTSGNTTINSTTGTSLTSLVTGAVGAGLTKLVSLATAGVAGSNSNVTIGPTLGVGNVFFQLGTPVTISNVTASINSNSGALVVSGGIGVSGNLNVGGGIGVSGNLNVGGTVVGGGIRTTSTITTPSNPTPGDIWYNTSTDDIYRYTSDGVNAYWLDITGPTISTTAQIPITTPFLTVTNTTTSTSSNTGALLVTGGVGISGNINVAGNVTAGNVTGTYYTTQNNKLAPRVRLVTTIVSTTISYVEFNFQPWLNTYRKFVLEFQGVEYTSSAYSKSYYLAYSYNLSGSQSFTSSPGSLLGWYGTGSVRYTGLTGLSATSVYNTYTSSTYGLQGYQSYGPQINANYIAPYGTVEFPNTYLTGVGGVIKVDHQYIYTTTPYVATDNIIEICPYPSYTIAGIRFYSSYGFFNTGTFILYGVDPV